MAPVWVCGLWSALVSERRPDNPTAPSPTLAWPSGISTLAHWSVQYSRQCGSLLSHCMAECRFGRSMSTSTALPRRPRLQPLWLGSVHKGAGHIDVRPDAFMLLQMQRWPPNIIGVMLLTHICHSRPCPAHNGYDPAPPTRSELTLHLA